MTGMRVILAFIALLIVLPFTPQIPGCVAAHRSKTGRVVDVETGKGLADAFVIASAHFASDPVFFGPSGNKDLYDIIVRTNEQGLFYMPSSWTDVVIGIPGTHSRVTWIVTVFQPGYADVRDEHVWEDLTEDGWLRLAPPSIYFSPKLSSVSWISGSLEPIEMFKPRFSLHQAAVYYGAIRGASHPMLGSIDPQIVALRKRGNDYFAPLVCSIPGDMLLDYSTSVAIYGFAMDEIVAMRLFEEIYPDIDLLTVRSRPDYKASAICKIVSEGVRLP